MLAWMSVDEIPAHGSSSKDSVMLLLLRCDFQREFPFLHPRIYTHRFKPLALLHRCGISIHVVFSKAYQERARFERPGNRARVNATVPASRVLEGCGLSRGQKPTFIRYSPNIALATLDNNCFSGEK